MRRPTVRSRRRLRAALMATLQERNYEDITLPELLAAADVGRSTFYAHYAGKDGLLRQSLEALGEEILEALPREPSHPFAFAEPLLDHVGQHRRLFRRLRGRGRAIALRELDRMAGEMIRAGMAACGPSGRDEIAARFLTGGFLALLTWWLEHSDPPPRSEVLSRLRSLAACLA